MDFDAELEKELAELLNESDADISTTISESNPEIEKLEQRLNDLRVEGKYYKIIERERELYIYIYIYISCKCTMQG